MYVAAVRLLAKGGLGAANKFGEHTHTYIGSMGSAVGDRGLRPRDQCSSCKQYIYIYIRERATLLVAHTECTRT